jgi:hypothetical protein
VRTACVELAGAARLQTPRDGEHGQAATQVGALTEEGTAGGARERGVAARARMSEDDTGQSVHACIEAAVAQIMLALYHAARPSRVAKVAVLALLKN